MPPSQLVQRIIALIRENLNTLEPGKPLPPELELCDRYGVSRKSIRTAMGILEQQGTIYRVRGKGTFPAESGRAPAAFISRALRIGAAGSIAIGNTGFYGTIMQGAYTQVVSQDGELILAGSSRENMFRLCSNGRADGLMLVSVTDQSLLNELAAQKIPLCLVDHYAEEAEIDCVRVDSFAGSRMAVEHLAALGHERIAYLHPDKAGLNPLRLKGYLTALKERGLPADKRLLKLVNGHGPAAAVTQLLSLSESQRPTALVAFSDDMAVTVMQAAIKFGFDVPGQLSVIGAGGSERVQTSGLPELTSIQFNTIDLGTTAIRCLTTRIADPSLPKQEIIIEPHLHLGASTARA